MEKGTNQLPFAAGSKELKINEIYAGFVLNVITIVFENVNFQYTTEVVKNEERKKVRMPAIFDLKQAGLKTVKFTAARR